MLSPSIALLISIGGILILLRLKIPTGFAIFAGSLIISFLVIPLADILQLFLNSFNYETMRLLVVVTSALILSRLMEEKGLLAKLATTSESINPKLALHIIPAMIGLVPMPAGALVSATASGNLSKKIGLRPEQSTFINYWFRHIWEFSVPVYPTVIITSAVLSLPLSFVVATLAPMSALSIAVGAIFSYRMLRKTPKIKVELTRVSDIINNLIKASWPILLLVPSILLGLDAIIAFPMITVLLAVRQKVNWPELRRALKYGLDLRILFLLYAVMLYKTAIESSNAASILLGDMQTIGLPTVVILIVLPLLMGLATGLSMAFAGVALPLLVPYILTDSGVNSYALLLAYTSGLMGDFLSPLHLCLILSTEYFKASLIKVYRYVLPLTLSIEAIAILLFYVTK